MRIPRLSVGVVILLVAASFASAQTDELIQGPFTDPAAPTEVTRDTETYGSASSGFAGEDRMRGNIFSVTTPIDLTMIEQYLDIPVSTTLHFSVYRKTNDGSVIGLYTRDFLADVAVTAAGATFYSSGVMSYTLDVTYYYYICAGWDIGDNITYYRGTDTVPLPTGFGALETGVPGGGAGNPATYNNTYTGFSPYYQRLTFTIVPVELMTFTVE